jgi:hypothetical protein
LFGKIVHQPKTAKEKGSFTPGDTIGRVLMEITIEEPLTST